MDYSNGLFDCQSPTSPFLGGLRVLHLLEDLRGALELMDNDERDNLRCQIPDSTAEGLAGWLHGRLVRKPLFQLFYWLWLTVYCTDAALSHQLNDGVSLSRAGNSFHGPGSCWFRTSLQFFFPPRPRLSSRDILNRLLI